MPFLDIEGTTIDLPRNVALVDTNVLVAYGDDRDQNHQQATVFIEAGDDYQLLITQPVIAETCAVLTRHRDLSTALGMLRWLLTPGDAIVLPAPHSPADASSPLGRHAVWMRQFDLDYVDAYLMEVAHLLTTTCGLIPHIPIATFDTRDFYRCVTRGYSFSIYDMRDLQLAEFS